MVSSFNGIFSSRLNKGNLPSFFKGYGYICAEPEVWYKNEKTGVGIYKSTLEIGYNPRDRKYQYVDFLTRENNVDIIEIGKWLNIEGQIRNYGNVTDNNQPIKSIVFADLIKTHPEKENNNEFLNFAELVGTFGACVEKAKYKNCSFKINKDNSRRMCMFSCNVNQEKIACRALDDDARYLNTLNVGTKLALRGHVFHDFSLDAQTVMITNWEPNR